MYAILPMTPSRLSTRGVMSKLKQRGFHVSKRTIERDLQKLIPKRVVKRTGEQYGGMMKGYFWSRTR